MNDSPVESVDENLDKPPVESSVESHNNIVTQRGVRGLFVRLFASKSCRFHLTFDDGLRAIATSGLLMTVLQYMAADMNFLHQYPKLSPVLSVLAAILIDLCHRYVGDAVKNNHHETSHPVPTPQS